MPPRRPRGSSTDDLQRFLVAMDEALAKPVEMVVIGGSAAALGYSAEITTRDIDTFGADRSIAAAATQASEVTGLDIPVHNASIADLPWNYADRLRRVMPQLLRLRVFVPDAHDLVLSKLIRGVEHDFDQIAAVHRHHGLNLETLVDRFVSEMSHRIGDPRTLELNLLTCLELLWGELVRSRVERRLLKRR